MTRSTLIEPTTRTLGGAAMADRALDHTAVASAASGPGPRRCLGLVGATARWPYRARLGSSAEMSVSESHPPAVEGRGLVREFNGGVRAVDGLDLEVGPGEICGYLGPNGAGETASGRILTTRLRPTA